MWALMVALHAMGREDVHYATLMAVSGWSAQFAYNPKPDSASFFEPCPTVARACQAVGVGLEEYRGSSPEEAWSFIREAIAGDRPVLVEYMEFGLFVDGADGEKVHDIRTGPAMHATSVGHLQRVMCNCGLRKRRTARLEGSN
jgi:hypothetical protein